MKKVTLILAATFFVFTLFGQTDYEKAIQNELDAFYQSSTLEEMQEASNKLERIAEAEPGEWLPKYYAAYIQTILAFNTQDSEKKKAYTYAAQHQVDKAIEIAPEESEIHTLQGMVYQAIIGIDPSANGKIYSDKATTSFNIAIDYDPENPRPYYLQALSVLYTPEQYGGGKKAAFSFFEKATELYENYKPESSISPNWGKEDCKRNLKAYSE